MHWINVPSDMPRHLQQVVCEALAARAGRWLVRLQRGLVGGWWFLELERDDGLRRGLLLPPREQEPAALGQAMEEALRSVVPHPRAAEGPPLGVPERRTVGRQ